MFETMQGFLCFFLPLATAILLGILFEERLIALEARIKSRFFARQKRKLRGKNRLLLTKVSARRSPHNRTAA